MRMGEIMEMDKISGERENGTHNRQGAVRSGVPDLA